MGLRCVTGIYIQYLIKMVLCYDEHKMIVELNMVFENKQDKVTYF